jgi:hypothetical protein
MQTLNYMTDAKDTCEFNWILLEANTKTLYLALLCMQNLKLITQDSAHR